MFINLWIFVSQCVGLIVRIFLQIFVFVCPWKFAEITHNLLQFQRCIIICVFGYCCYLGWKSFEFLLNSLMLSVFVTCDYLKLNFAVFGQGYVCVIFLPASTSFFHPDYVEGRW